MQSKYLERIRMLSQGDYISEEELSPEDMKLRKLYRPREEPKEEIDIEPVQGRSSSALLGKVAAKVLPALLKGASKEGGRELTDINGNTYTVSHSKLAEGGLIGSLASMNPVLKEQYGAFPAMTGFKDEVYPAPSANPMKFADGDVVEDSSPAPAEADAPIEAPEGLRKRVPLGSDPDAPIRAATALRLREELLGDKELTDAQKAILLTRVDDLGATKGLKGSDVESKYKEERLKFKAGPTEAPPAATEAPPAAEPAKLPTLTGETKGKAPEAAPVDEKGAAVLPTGKKVEAEGEAPPPAITDAGGRSVLATVMKEAGRAERYGDLYPLYQSTKADTIAQLGGLIAEPDSPEEFLHNKTLVAKAESIADRVISERASYRPKPAAEKSPEVQAAEARVAALETQLAALAPKPAPGAAGGPPLPGANVPSDARTELIRQAGVQAGMGPRQAKATATEFGPALGRVSPVTEATIAATPEAQRADQLAAERRLQAAKGNAANLVLIETERGLKDAKARNDLDVDTRMQAERLVKKDQAEQLRRQILSGGVSTKGLLGYSPSALIGIALGAAGAGLGGKVDITDALMYRARQERAQQLELFKERRGLLEDLVKETGGDVESATKLLDARTKTILAAQLELQGGAQLDEMARTKAFEAAAKIYADADKDRDDAYQRLGVRQKLEFDTSIDSQRQELAVMKALLDTAQSARDAGIRVREAAATRTAAARAKDVVGPPEYQPVLDAALNTGYASADQAKAIRKYDKDRAKQLVSIIVPITDSSGRTTYSKDPRYEVLLKESVDPKKVSEGIGAVLALESTIGEMESIADAAGYDYITLARNPKYQALVERATVLTGRASDAGVLASEEKSQFKNFIDPSSPLNSVPFKKGFYKAFREQMFNEHRDSLEAQLIRSAPPDVRKIPADAIRELKSKPDTWKDFDAAFGAGASTEVLRAR